MVKDFSSLRIDGAFIGELTVVPTKKLRLSLFRGPLSKSERQMAEEFDLQFNKVEGFRFDLDAKPWLEIVSHKVLAKSDYITSYLADIGKEGRKPKANRGKLYHFQIVCQEGQLEVLAEQFSISLVNEIPYFESKSIEKID